MVLDVYLRIFMMVIMTISVETENELTKPQKIRSLFLAKERKLKRQLGAPLAVADAIHTARLTTAHQAQKYCI